MAGNTSAELLHVAACVPRPSQVALQKVVVEKIGFKSLHAVYIAKSSETMFSHLAVGFENFCWPK